MGRGHPPADEAGGFLQPRKEMRFIEDRRVPGLVDVPARVRRRRVRIVVVLAALALAVTYLFAPPIDRLAHSWSTVFAAEPAAPATAAQ